jgi:hypothetical protein
MLKSNQHVGLNVILTYFLESPFTTPLLKSKKKLLLTISLTFYFSDILSSSIPVYSSENSTKIFVLDLLLTVIVKTLLNPTVIVLKSISEGLIEISPSFPAPTTRISYF